MAASRNRVAKRYISSKFNDPWRDSDSEFLEHVKSRRQTMNGETPPSRDSMLRMLQEGISRGNSIYSSAALDSAKFLLGKGWLRPHDTDVKKILLKWVNSDSSGVWAAHAIGNHWIERDEIKGYPDMHILEVQYGIVPQAEGADESDMTESEWTAEFGDLKG